MRMRLQRCARCQFRRASCWRAYRGACASVAARISDRPTRIRRCGFETIRLAGEQGVPLTTGILIGIGETRAERVQSLLAIRDLHERYGHIQEVIIQNFRPKPGTRMAQTPAAATREHLWTIAVARLLFEPEMNIQAPPNLAEGDLAPLIGAGINDWGGVSPVTPDHVNPEAPWPQLSVLEAACTASGKLLVERLAIYPQYLRALDRWVDPGLRTARASWRRCRRLAAHRCVDARCGRALAGGRSTRGGVETGDRCRAIYPDCWTAP